MVRNCLLNQLSVSLVQAKVSQFSFQHLSIFSQSDSLVGELPLLQREATGERLEDSNQSWGGSTPDRGMALATSMDPLQVLQFIPCKKKNKKDWYRK